MKNKIIALFIVTTLCGAGIYFYQNNSIIQIDSVNDKSNNSPLTKLSKKSADYDVGGTSQTTTAAATQFSTAAKSNEINYGTPSIKAANTAARNATSALDFLAKIKADPAISMIDRQYYITAVHSVCSSKQLQDELKKPVDPNAAMIDMTPPPMQTPVISASDPNAALRLAAQAHLKQKSPLFDNYCANFPKINNAQLLSMLQDGEKLGDARSTVILQTKEINQKAPKIPDWPISPEGLEIKMPIKPPADYFAKIQAALNTKDPSAIQAIGPLLFNSYEEGQFVFGPNNETFSAELRKHLWGLVSCEFGANCSPSSIGLASVCAFNGVCNIMDVDTYMRNYTFSKTDLEQLDRIRPLLVKAIKTGDWSDVRYLSPPPVGASKNIFGPHVKIGLGG